MEPDCNLVAGNQVEVAAFAARNKPFLESVGVLEHAFNALFARDLKSVGAADAVVFYLGRRCVDDFLEIMLLCANGYSQGASSLLRGLYERAVTAAYLHENPDAAADFLEYDYVRRRKLMRAIESMPDAPSELVDGVEELEAQYLAVRDRFMVTDCATCESKRLNHTWSKLDFVSMAGKSGRLAGLVIPAYYLPLGNAHSTLVSISSRLVDEGGSLSRISEPNYAEADLVLQTAHGVILLVLATQLDHFGDSECASAVDAAVAAYNPSWALAPTG